MLKVKTPEEVLRLIETEFRPLGRAETVPLAEALGRVLAEDIRAEEYVPDFDRSTVDGYACRAGDTFGCSDAIPAILKLVGEVRMGDGAAIKVPRDACVYVPTGGAIPADCDCAVMLEYVEDYGDGTVGILKPGKPMILGKAGDKPLIGLPGHPVAAFFAARLFVLPLLARLEGRTRREYPVRAALGESLNANHGRMQLSACRLEEKGGRLTATPIRSKSGLITQLAGADGWLVIGRDCEGLPKDAEVEVFWN